VGPQPVLPKLTLHAPHDLEGMLEGVEVVVRALFDAPCEGELPEGSQEPNDVERRPERLTRVQGTYRLRRAFLRLVFGLGRPFSESAASPSSPVAEGFSGLVCWVAAAKRRLRLRSTKA
jgi:hypothetical protein